MEKKKGNIFGRIFRLFFSVIILSAFIIGLSFLIRGIYNTNQDKLVSGIHKILTKANIDIEEERVGQVAGTFIKRVTSTNISSSSTSRTKDNSSANEGIALDGGVGSVVTSSTSASLDTLSAPYLQIAIIADVHSDLASLERSLSLMKKENIKYLFVIGDITNYGDVASLQEVKDVLDASGITYYVLPGDHDLAETLGADNFVKVFGDDNFYEQIEGINFLFLNNSANFTPLLPSTISWFESQVEKSDFVIMSQPLYTDLLNLPFKKMYMGSTQSEPPEELVENQQRVKAQRDLLLKSIQNYPVLALLAGDHHKSNTLSDSVSDLLKHHTLGSIASELNGMPQSILQSPRFSILKIYDKKTFEVVDVTID